MTTIYGSGSSIAQAGKSLAASGRFPSCWYSRRLGVGILAFVVGGVGFMTNTLASLSSETSKTPVLTFTPVGPLPLEVYRGATSKFEFHVVNKGEKSLTIGSIFPRKGRGSGFAKPAKLEPGSMGRIVLTYTFPEALGRDQVNFLVKTDDPDNPTQVIRVPIFVQSAYEPELFVLDFGDMQAGQKLQTTLEIGSRLNSDLEFTSVVSKPDWLDIDFKESSRRSSQFVDVIATTNRIPAYGLNVGEVILESNVAESPKLRIPVLIRVFSKYRVDKMPVSLGGVPEGEDRKVTLRITRIDGGAIDLEGIDTGSASLTAQTLTCGSDCLDLIVDFDSMKARRSLRAMLKATFSDDDVVLKIPIDALVVPIGVKIVDLGNLDDITVKSKTINLSGKK